MDFGGSSEVSATDSKETSSSTTATSGSKTSQLQLEQEAIDKIIGDVLGSETGLASIFASENVAGLFDSSVSAQASGDLVANLVGELAKITGKTVTDVEEESQTDSRTDASEFNQTHNITAQI